MTQPIPGKESAALEAARKLASLQAQFKEEGAALARVQEDVVEPELNLNDIPRDHLVEANERLVLAALSAQAETDAATRALHEIARSAELDPLTRLPNRVLLLDRFGRAIAVAKRHRTRLALLFLDLNSFKQINDTLGHAVGDEVLKLVAQRLVSSVREADTVSRHGGDEFVLLLTDVSRVADAGRVASKIIAALGVPGRVGNHVIQLEASIGISIYPDDGEDAAQLMARADAAMYTAKRRGLGGFAFDGAEAQSEPSLESPEGALSQYDLPNRELTLDEQKRRNAQLRGANEQLVLSALSAQELKSATEKARRKHAELLASLARELHKPLAPIRAAAALLGRSRTDGQELAEARALIERQVGDMSRLVGKLLEISAASEAGHAAQRAHPKDLE